MINGFGVFIVVFVVAIPIAWLGSEFQERRWIRILLGSVAISLSFGVASVVGSLERFNSNAWFGEATQNLIDTTVVELEAGNNDLVLRPLKNLQKKYEPTYENRALYDHLVEQAVKEMKSRSPIQP